jgi:glycosyltransferase involved in cell wall biosynthesis
MRIVLTCASFCPSYGGPAFSVAQLANALAGTGIEVGLWAPDQTAGTTTTIPPTSPVRRLIGTEIEAIETFGPVDVLHDNGIWLQHNHRLATLATARRIPRIVSTRGMLEPWALQHKHWRKRLAWRVYQRRDLTFARCHHTTSSREAKNLQRLKLGVPICMIPNGIEIAKGDHSADATAKKEKSNKARCALFLGRIYPVKGLPLLIEAWARLQPKNWYLKIAGPDQAGCRAKLDSAIAAAGLEDTISFLGPLDSERKRAAFFEADLFVLPSYSESFGMVVAEALAHCLPVLTTTATPWPMLSARGCGWWVEPTVDGLVAGLRDATSCDRETLSAMGVRGQAFIAGEFRWEVIARRFLSMYETLLDAHSARRLESESSGS